MRATKAKRFYVSTDSGEWGPIPWQLLREWLGRAWLDGNTQLRPETESGSSPASEFDQLWKIAGRPFVYEDVSSLMAAGKVPASPTLKRHLQQTLGWPGSVDPMNYYDGNKLREALEKLFPDEKRPPFDDPAWPECWGPTSPAVLAQEEAERRAAPITENQAAVLRYFSKADGVASKGEASDLIGQLFSDPTKLEAWENEKARRHSKQPATEAQMFRIKFAAERLKVSVPRRLSKRQASELITKWYEENPGLEFAYQEYWELREETEIEAIIREHEAEVAANEEAEFAADEAKGKGARKSGCLGVLVVGLLLVALLIIRSVSSQQTL